MPQVQQMDSERVQRLGMVTCSWPFRFHVLTVAFAR